MPHLFFVLAGCSMILTGLFISRSLMSIGMMVLFGNALLNQQFSLHLKRFFQEPVYWMLSLYVLLLAVTRCWTTDTAFWANRMQIQLPFLVLPLAFASFPDLPARWYKRLIHFFMLLLLAGMGWSLVQYFQHKDAYDVAYGFSKLLPTPFRNDHIRFSLAVVTACLFAVDFLFEQPGKRLTIFYLFFLFFATIYLHLLAARTGLAAYYVSALALLLRLFRDARFRHWRWKLLLLLISIPLFMYTTSVSLQHKIGYMVYSWHEIMTPRKDLQISDEGRLLTDHYALRGLAAHPWTGVGLGDVKPYMMQQILKDFPDYKGDVMLPHNQFLMAGLAGGMGMMLYVLLMTIICLIRARRTWISFVFCSIMVLAMLVEPLFETQYGTCIFLFFLLLLLQHGSRRV